MGSSVIDDVASCEGRVKAAEQHLKAQQMNKETAKKAVIIRMYLRVMLMAN